MKFHIFTATEFYILVLWVVILHSLVEGYFFFWKHILYPCQH